MLSYSALAWRPDLLPSCNRRLLTHAVYQHAPGFGGALIPGARRTVPALLVSADLSDPSARVRGLADRKGTK